MLNFLKYSLDNVVEDVSNGDIYIVIGNHKGVSNSETTTQNELIFGKRVTNTDYAYLVDKNIWTSNTIYDTYLEANSNPYYIINQNNDVYKCVWNNNGNPSTSEPLTKTIELIETSDNYIWKYLYTISTANLNTFGSTTNIPITANSDVTANAIPGSIDYVRVDEGGSNFIVYNTGTVKNVIDNKIIQIEDTASATANVYLDSSFYIRNGTGAGTIKTIDKSFANSIGKFIEFSTNTVVGTDSEYIISPRVSITARQGSGFLAYSTANNGIIDSINVIDSGNNYIDPKISLITSSVVTQPSFTYFLSPKNGHGSDVIKELDSEKLYLTKNFLLNESQTLPNTDFTYYQASLIYNPVVDVQSQNTISYSILANTTSSINTDVYVVGETSNASAYVYWSNTTHIMLNNIIGNFTNGENLVLPDDSLVLDMYIEKEQDGSGGDILYYYNNSDGIERVINTSEDIGFIIDLGS